jgi:hypothetical protein
MRLRAEDKSVPSENVFRMLLISRSLFSFPRASPSSLGGADSLDRLCRREACLQRGLSIVNGCTGSLLANRVLFIHERVHRKLPVRTQPGAPFNPHG